MSIVTPSNIMPQYLKNTNKKIVDKAGEFLKPRSETLNNKRRFSFLVSASSDWSPQGVGVDTINTTNHVPLAPLENENTPLVTFLRGCFVEETSVYRQIFIIRSYDIGPDKTLTIETLMNFLQETALNQVASCGVSGNNFGTTREMDLHKLIWVATRIQVQVHRYSKWGDEIEVDTWFDAVGKNGMRRDWIVRDRYTKETIARATSTWTMMNKETRRLSKIPEEVRQEIVPLHYDRLAISEEIDCEKIHKLTDDTAESVRSGIVPRWNDMDVNQHVNNVKYIGWILESVPKEVLADYNMTNMTLEFRRECTQSNVLESMTSPSSNMIGASNNNNSVNRKFDLQYTHLLRLQDHKAELVRARTEWRLKQKH